MECHICGRKTELARAEVEGVILDVCGDCSRFGKVLYALTPQQLSKAAPKPRRPDPEELEVVVPDAGARIKARREKLSLTQEQLARKIAQRESFIQKVEAGAMELSISLAKKIEQQLNIVLVEEAEPAAFIPAKQKSEGMTLGDLIKKKMIE